MAVGYKNYYQVLEVRRQASEAEIRRAFRRLARCCHPDVAGQDLEAESKFKEVNEAYEILRHPDRRRKYDRFLDFCRNGEGKSWGGRSRQGEGFEFRFARTGYSDWFEEFAPGQGGEEAGRGRGEDVESEILISTLEAVQGSVRPITLQRLRRCERCGGSGRRSEALCETCTGAGHLTELETCQVRVPPGVTEGQRLRIPGHGERSQGTGLPGDLYLRVRFAAHPDVRIEGADIVKELMVAPWEAVLGATITLPLLGGEIQVRVPPGSQGGQRLRLAGYGLRRTDGERGDLYAVLRVQVPPVATGNERKLWEELAAESKFEPRLGAG